jgi:hypothetical protein
MQASLQSIAFIWVLKSFSILVLLLVLMAPLRLPLNLKFCLLFFTLTSALTSIRGNNVKNIVNARASKDVITSKMLALSLLSFALSTTPNPSILNCDNPPKVPPSNVDHAKPNEPKKMKLKKAEGETNQVYKDRWATRFSWSKFFCEIEGKMTRVA